MAGHPAKITRHCARRTARSQTSQANSRHRHLFQHHYYIRHHCRHRGLNDERKVHGVSPTLGGVSVRMKKPGYGFRKRQLVLPFATSGVLGQVSGAAPANTAKSKPPTDACCFIDDQHVNRSLNVEQRPKEVYYNIADVVELQRVHIFNCSIPPTGSILANSRAES